MTAKKKMSGNTKARNVRGKPATSAPVGEARPNPPTPAPDAAPPAVAESVAKGARKPKAPKPPKPKRISGLDAAAIVLAQKGAPMSAKQMVEAAAEQGLWTSKSGRTPAATVYAAIIREVAAKGKDARFVKTDRGLFAARGA